MTTKALNEATFEKNLIGLTSIIIDRRERPLKIKGKGYSNGPSVSFIFSLMGFSIFSKYEFCKPIMIKKIWYRHVPGKCCIGVAGIRPTAILSARNFSCDVQVVEILTRG